MQICSKYLLSLDNFYSQLCLPCLLHFTGGKRKLQILSPNSFCVIQLGSDGGRIWTWVNLALPILLCHLTEAQVWWSLYPSSSPEWESWVGVCVVCCLARTARFQPCQLLANLWELGVSLHMGFSSCWDLDSSRDLNGSQGCFGALIF